MSKRATGFLDQQTSCPTAPDGQQFLFVDYGASESKIVNSQELQSEFDELYKEDSTDPNDWCIDVYEINGVLIKKEVEAKVTLKWK